MTAAAAPPGESTITRLTRAILWVAVPALFFVELFVTFRGLSSPLGMEQAQVARELARGRGLHTQVVRPYAWRQLLDHGRAVSPLEMSDTFTPPLHPLVLAPLLKAFEPFWDFDTRKGIYFMDRVVAAAGMLLFLASAGVAWLTARRLFDATIAGWTVVALLACQFLWDVARSGLPQMLALFFFSIALLSLVRALEDAARGEGGFGRPLTIGAMGALTVMTHWMGVWLVLGLAGAAAWQLRPRLRTVILIATPALTVLCAWGWRNHVVSGDPFGTAKATLQSALAFASDSWLLRDFSGNSPPASAEFVVRKLATNVTGQITGLYTHLGAALPAALFFLALLHPFRRPEVRAFARSLGIVWLAAVLGMALVGLPAREQDANQIHSLFVPAMTAFGFAFLAVLWGRLGIGHARSSWWSRHGLAAAACSVGALPMAVSLPTELTLGLNLKDEFAHWPPYLPRQIHKVSGFTAKEELVFSDLPWAVAWYADRTGVWLPMKRPQFDEMRQMARDQGVETAGLLMTPESLRAEHPAEVLTGEYRDWARHAFRGILAGFGIDLMAQVDFPYREFKPLAGQPGAEPGRFVAEMAFMSDRRRWEEPAGDPADKQRPKTAASAK